MGSIRKHLHAMLICFATSLIGLSVTHWVGCSGTAPIPSKDFEVDDIHCNGQELSVVLSEQISMYSGDIGHTGGYLKSYDEHSRLIKWSIDTKSRTMTGVPSVSDLSDFSMKRDNGDSPLMISGTSAKRMRINTSSSSVLHYSDKLSLIGRAFPQIEADTEEPYGLPLQNLKVKYALSSDRSHVLPIKVNSSIYDTTTLTIAKQLKATHTFSKFVETVGACNYYHFLLTNDLTHVVAASAPHRLGRPDPTLGKPPFAYLYDIDTDEMTQVIIDNYSDGGIEDVQLVSGDLHWLIRANANEISAGLQKWVVLDGQYRPLNGFGVQTDGFGRNVYHLSWMPNQKEVWIMQHPSMIPSIELAKMSLYRHDLATNTRECLVRDYPILGKEHTSQ